MTAEEKEMEAVNLSTDVLVIGGGFTGVKAASEIVRQGYAVVLLESTEDIGKHTDSQILPGFNKDETAQLETLVREVRENERIEVLTQARLIKAGGISGDFKLTLSHAGNLIERRAGAIVAANECLIRPLNEAYGLNLSDCILTQTQLEKKLAEPDQSEFIGKTVSFITGLSQEGNPLILERVFHSILSVQEIDETRVYVYTGDLKVASEGLSKVYKQTRDQGAIYFKLNDMPQFNDNGKLLRVYDPILRQVIELETDFLIIEEEICASPFNAGIAKILRIDQGGRGFLQSDNVHRFPVRSNREGIFLTGFSRDIQNLSTAFIDAENAAIEVKHFLGKGTKLVPKDKAVVDPKKCVVCLTCYRYCPHGAISWANNRAVISPVACQGCGVCASECPQDAIQILGFNDQDIKGELEKAQHAQIIAFCCENSAFEAGQMAEVFKMKLPAGLEMIQVPCAGKVDLDYIMTAFVNGADGVLIMACHHGNCKSERGNIYAGWRVDDAHRMMLEIGLEKERLVFAAIAANMGSDFVRITTEMENQINDLGPSPLKK